MKLLLSTISIFVLTLCVNAQYKDSLKTFRKLTKSFQKYSDFVFVPSGAFNTGMADYNPPSPGAGGNYLMSRGVQVDSFFMQKFEVSNAQYLEFLKGMSKTDSVLSTYLPDTLVWRTPLAFGEKYVDYYLRHPAYANYPVVGVSYKQAMAYAAWKTQQYNSREDRKFKEVLFRLPTEEEWEFAAKGDNNHSYLPWDEPNTIDENGLPRANFMMISQLGVYRDTFPDRFPQRSLRNESKVKEYLLSTGTRSSAKERGFGAADGQEYLKPVESYEPNIYGLYQMAGNVEEMVDAYYYRDPKGYYFTHEITQFKHYKPWGVTKGGSWNDPGYYLQWPMRQFYEDEHSASIEIGFRLVMDVLEF